MSVLSLYIPVITDAASEQFIKKMFKTNNIGTILRVDFVKNKEKNRREAFIHFDEWFTTDESKTLQEDILNPDTRTRFKYTKSGKFWPLLVNKNPHKRVNNPKYEILTDADIKNEYTNVLNNLPVINTATTTSTSTTSISTTSTSATSTSATSTSATNTKKQKQEP